MEEDLGIWIDEWLPRVGIDLVIAALELQLSALKEEREDQLEDLKERLEDQAGF